MLEWVSLTPAGLQSHCGKREVRKQLQAPTGHEKNRWLAHQEQVWLKDQKALSVRSFLTLKKRNLRDHDLSVRLHRDQYIVTRAGCKCIYQG
jgi:hypothetical protein